jgi:hypothetical protein
MKKTVLYCDRHDGEHPAITSVWIKTLAMPRIVRVDVCGEAFDAMVGGLIPTNGRRMLAAPTGEPRPYVQTKRPRGIGTMPGSDRAKLTQALRAYVKNAHQRFTLDEIGHAMAGLKLSRTSKDGHGIGPVVSAFISDGTLERHGNFGVYSVKGVPAPPKVSTPEEVATAVAKCIRAHPGLRVAYLPGLLDLEPPVVKRTVRHLIETGLVKTKGQRSSSRAWPVEQKK